MKTREVFEANQFPVFLFLVLVFSKYINNSNVNTRHDNTLKFKRNIGVLR